MKGRRDQDAYQVRELEHAGSRGNGYELIEVKILKPVGHKKRTDIINHIIEERNAIGSIEWWTRGSIIGKPMFTFHLILVF